MSFCEGKGLQQDLNTLGIFLNLYVYLCLAERVTIQLVQHLFACLLVKRFLDRNGTTLAVGLVETNPNTCMKAFTNLNYVK